MKRFLTVALALCLVFCLAQVTVADERLKLDGDVRIRAQYYDNFSFYQSSDPEEEFEGGIEDDTQRYVDMRFRLGMTVTAAPGVTGFLRMDFQDDSVWGLDTGGLGRPLDSSTVSNKELQMDRAGIRIERDMFIFQGGQIFQAFGAPGLATAYAPQAMGMAVRLKMPVLVDFNWFKVSEGGSYTDASGARVITDDDGFEDIDQYALQAQFKASAFQIGGYYAMQTDGTDADNEPFLIGLWGNTKLGPVALRGAVDMFGGQISDDVDVMGTQLWLNGEMNITPAAIMGLDFYYALGTEEDDEVQMTAFPGKFGGFEPMERGMQFLTDINQEPIGTNQPFNPSGLVGDSGGSMGFDVYGIFKATDKITVAGLIGYFMPQEDDATDWESTTSVQASVRYTFAPKCDLIGAVFWRSIDVDDFDTDDAIGAVAALQIGF